MLSGRSFHPMFKLMVFGISILGSSAESLIKCEQSRSIPRGQVIFPDSETEFSVVSSIWRSSQLKITLKKGSRVKIPENVKCHRTGEISIKSYKSVVLASDCKAVAKKTHDTADNTFYVRPCQGINVQLFKGTQIEVLDCWLTDKVCDNYCKSLTKSLKKKTTAMISSGPYNFIEINYQGTIKSYVEIVSVNCKMSFKDGSQIVRGKFIPMLAFMYGYKLPAGEFYRFVKTNIKSSPMLLTKENLKVDHCLA